jgi:hypothetical protein
MPMMPLLVSISSPNYTYVNKGHLGRVLGLDGTVGIRLRLLATPSSPSCLVVTPPSPSPPPPPLLFWKLLLCCWPGLFGGFSVPLWFGLENCGLGGLARAEAEGEKMGLVGGMMSGTGENSRLSTKKMGGTFFARSKSMMDKN